MSTHALRYRPSANDQPLRWNMQVRIRGARFSAWIVAVCAITFCSQPLNAVADDTLAVGDAAPQIHIARWILGSPVDDVGQRSEKVYVLCFWASWSEPSLEGLMTLSKLQRDSTDEDLVVIAISEESPKQLEEFVARHRSELTLRLAADEDRRSTVAYMFASGQHAVPHVFVINREGVLAWQGHPSEADTVVRQVVDGSYEIVVPPPDRSSEDLDSTVLGEEDEIDSNATMEELTEIYIDAVRQKRWRRAIQAIDLIRQKTEDPDEAIALLGVKFRILFEELTDYESAKALAEEILKKHKEHPILLNDLAWTLLARGSFATLEHRWPEIAHRAAYMAHEASKGQDPAILDTYARSQYLLGHVDRAIELQEKSLKKIDQQIEDLEDRASPADLEALRSVRTDMKNTLDYYNEIQKFRDG